MKKYWVFCKNCGESYQITDRKVQFCSKKCVKSWINCENEVHISVLRNFGQRDSTQYSKWKRLVRKKFNNKCAICGENHCELHSHHIIPWADSYDLRYEVLNGLLVCNLCHTFIHGYSINCGTKILKDKKRMIEVRKIYIDIANIKYVGQ